MGDTFGGDLKIGPWALVGGPDTDQSGYCVIDLRLKMGRRRSKSSSKRKKKKKPPPLDIISNLPSDVTRHTLSYLHLKEAVKTSVFSKTWRHKWAMRPSLAFDDTCGSSIRRIIYHVLFSHTGPVECRRFQDFN
ncbi:hypothetical protein ACLB2K_076305 [Fragaria x ananassa]